MGNEFVHPNFLFQEMIYFRILFYFIFELFLRFLKISVEQKIILSKIISAVEYITVYRKSSILFQINTCRKCIISIQILKMLYEKGSLRH